MRPHTGGSGRHQACPPTANRSLEQATRQTKTTLGRKNGRLEDSRRKAAGPKAWDGLLIEGLQVLEGTSFESTATASQQEEERAVLLRSI
jgi:hypothetical protein